MDKKKRKTTEVKVRYGKCAVCTARKESAQLFIVPHIIGLESVKMCGPCGKKKIDEWNSMIKQDLAS